MVSKFKQIQWIIITKLFAEKALVKPSYLHITEKFSGIYYRQCEKGHHMVCLAGRIANVVCAWCNRIHAVYSANSCGYSRSYRLDS